MSDLRDALNAAVESTREEEAPAEVAPVESTPEPVEAAESTPAPSGKERDESGRFAPKAKAAKESAPVVDKATAAPPVAAATAPVVAKDAPPVASEPIKAPQAWTPAEREAWAAIPPATQAAIHRRETEIATTLQGVAEAKRTHQAFADVVAPYRALLGSADPMGAAKSYFETAAQLQTAPVPQKAAILARMIQNFGVPVEALAAALDGTPQPQKQAPQYQADPRVDQLFAQLQQHQQGQRQQLTTQATQSVAEFKKGAEFFDDLHLDMADLSDLAHKRNPNAEPIPLQELYDRAARMHPEISKIFAQREAAKTAAASAASVQKARAASSSVRSSPAPAVSGTSDGSVGSDLRASIAALSGR